MEKNATKLLLLRIFGIKAVSDLLIGSFFVIFVYRVTGRISITFIGLAIFALAIFLGIITSVLLVRKFRFLDIIRISFLGLGILYLSTAVFYSQLATGIFFFIAIFGYLLGIYYLGQNMCHVTFIQNHDQRHNVVFSKTVLERLLGIILPIIGGYIIQAQGYTWLFVVTGVFMILASIPSLKAIYIEKEQDVFVWKELMAMLRLSNMKNYFVFMGVGSFLNEFRNASLWLIPFFLLGRSELNIGIYLGAIAIVSSIVTFFARNSKDKITQKYAILGGIIISLSNLLLGIVWTAYMLVIRSLLTPFGEIFFNPQSESDDYNLLRDVLGDQNPKFGIEMQLVRELIIFLGRVTSYMVFVAILMITQISYVQFGQISTLALAFWPLIYFIWREQFLINVDGKTYADVTVSLKNSSAL